MFFGSITFSVRFGYRRVHQRNTYIAEMLMLFVKTPGDPLTSREKMDFAEME